MAYGKTPTPPDAELTTFRQQIRGQQALRPPRPQGGQEAPRAGGGIPYFIDMYKPPLGEADLIRILRGSYRQKLAREDAATRTHSVVEMTLPYVLYREHFDGQSGKSSICSAGPLAMVRESREPCLGCDIYWDEFVKTPKTQGRRKQGRMSNREHYGFSILLYAPHVRVEQTNPDGTFKCGRNNEPFMKWMRVGENQLGQYAGREIHHAHPLHMGLGASHFSVIRSFDKEIGKSCRSCGIKSSKTARGEIGIKSEAWCCKHCNEPAIEMDNTPLSPDEIEQISLDPYTCEHCHQTGMLYEIISCTNCATPERAEIFDVDIEIKRIAATDGGNQTSLQVTGWSAPCPVDPAYEALAVPKDLLRIFTPTPLAQQATLFGVNPQALRAAAAPQRPQAPPPAALRPAAPPTAGARPYGVKAPSPETIPAPPAAEYDTGDYADSDDDKIPF